MSLRNKGEVTYNIQHKVNKLKDVGQTNTAKLNWLVYNVGSYGMIEHSLSDHACVACFDYRLLSKSRPGWVNVYRLHMYLPQK